MKQQLLTILLINNFNCAPKKLKNHHVISPLKITSTTTPEQKQQIATQQARESLEFIRREGIHQINTCPTNTPTQPFTPTNQEQTTYFGNNDDQIFEQNNIEKDMISFKIKTLLNTIQYKEDNFDTKPKTTNKSKEEELLNYLLSALKFFSKYHNYGEKNQLIYNTLLRFLNKYNLDQKTEEEKTLLRTISQILLLTLDYSKITDDKTKNKHAQQKFCKRLPTHQTQYIDALYKIISQYIDQNVYSLATSIIIQETFKKTVFIEHDAMFIFALYKAINTNSSITTLIPREYLEDYLL